MVKASLTASGGEKIVGSNPTPANLHEELEWWVKLTFGACYMKERDGIIVAAAPILGKFVGQPIDNLIRWKQFIERKRINI